MQTKYLANVWTHKIAFYLDGVSFYYKRHPLDQAREQRGRFWRKENEGLLQDCTAKGQKEGSGGKLLKLMVVTKGVIECYPYMNTLFCKNH